MSRICSRCSLPIESKAAKLGVKFYHPECFVCNQCRESLKGKPVHIHDDQIYDTECYHLFHAQRCDMCHAPIPSDHKFIKCDTKQYHSKCYVCYFCRKSLVGVHFIREGDKPICRGCKDNECNNIFGTDDVDDVFKGDIKGEFL